VKKTRRIQEGQYETFGAKLLIKRGSGPKERLTLTRTGEDETGREGGRVSDVKEKVNDQCGVWGCRERNEKEQRKTNKVKRKKKDWSNGGNP